MRLPDYKAVNNWREFFFKKPVSYFLVAMAKRISGLFLILLVCGILFLFLSKKEGESTSIETSLQINPDKPVHKEFGNLQQPGRWLMSTTLINNDGKINESIANAWVSWALNGHCQITETEVQTIHGKKYALDVTTLNRRSKSNRLHRIKFQDDGLVFGFLSRGINPQGVIDWEKYFPPQGVDGVRFELSERHLGGEKIESKFKVIKKGFPVKNGNSEMVFLGDVGSGRKIKSTPISAELRRLGKAGLWKDTQSLTTGNITKSVTMTNRMRWAWGGRALINEGVISSEGEEEELFLWVKTWDPVPKLYRYTYFYEDGPVHQFIGKWDEEGGMIKWASISPAGMYEMTEVFVNPAKRTYTMIIKIGDDTYTGQGMSDYLGAES